MNAIFNPVAIAAALRARYPGVRVVSVEAVATGDGVPQQVVRFQAPLNRLIDCGLVTDEMVRNGRDSRCGAQTTPLGCGFTLFLQGALDRDSDSSVAELMIYTGLYPRTRENLSVNLARSILRKYTLRLVTNAPVVQKSNRT